MTDTATIPTTNTTAADQLAECPCSYRPSEFHDLLLTIEDGGLPVALELATRAATWREMHYDDDLAEPDEWLAFVAAHNWRHPETVTEMVRVITDLANRPITAAPDAGLSEEVRELLQDMLDKRDRLQLVPGVSISNATAAELGHLTDQLEMVAPLLDDLARRAFDALNDFADEMAQRSGSLSDTLYEKASRMIGADQAEARLRYLGRLLVKVSERRGGCYNDLDAEARQA